MHRNRLVKLLIGIVLVAFTSCGGSDDDESDNFIRYGSEKLRVYLLYHYKYSETLQETGSTPFVVSLLGEGVKYSTDNAAFTGTGSLIRLYMYSESNVEVKNGDYTIDIFSTKQVYSADSCSVYFNYNFDVDTGKVYPVKAGVFKVENLGRLMSYKLNMVNADSLHFVGEYKGVFNTL